MSKITIKAYTRRGKKGKPVRVKHYQRRIGRKGVRLPKETKATSSGKELEDKILQKTPQLTPEELALRRKNAEGFNRAEEARKALGMSREQYSRYILSGKGETAKVKTKTSPSVIKVTPKKKPSGVLESIEDKVANFVEKHSGRKYKRQL